MAGVQRQAVAGSERCTVPAPIHHSSRQIQLTAFTEIYKKGIGIEERYGLGILDIFWWILPLSVPFPKP